MLQCGLCQSQLLQHSFKKHGRDFYHCSVCDLLSVDPAQHLSVAQEKARYDQHKNTVDNTGYIDFLRRLKVAVLPHLVSGSAGLDFGSGPNDILAQIFREDGFSVLSYDPFYSNHDLTSQQFDFIVCCEAAEHFKTPHKEILLMTKLLKEKGLLAFMTGIYSSTELSPDWWYLRDPTHVSFYSLKTFEWIASHFNLALEAKGTNIVLLKR